MLSNQQIGIPSTDEAQQEKGIGPTADLVDAPWKNGQVCLAVLAKNFQRLLHFSTRHQTSSHKNVFYRNAMH